MHTPFLIIAASAITIIWIAGIILIGDYKNVLDLQANEIGDFLSGAFSPLAFLWFLVAVFMQKLELRQARETHMLQLEEFRESTKANRDIADTNNRDAAINELNRLYTTNLTELKEHFRAIFSKLKAIAHNKVDHNIPDLTIDTTAEAALMQIINCQGEMLCNSDVWSIIEKLDLKITEITDPMKRRYGADNFEAALKTSELLKHIKQFEKIKEQVYHKITQFELENTK